MSERDEVIRLLDAAKALLIEKGWAQGFYARDAAGEVVSVEDPTACSFCAMGALVYVTQEASRETSRSAFNAMERAVSDGNIARYNDAPERTKEEVLALFDKAKELINVA